jgi:hypothetical protein
MLVLLAAVCVLGAAGAGVAFQTQRADKRLKAEIARCSEILTELNWNLKLAEQEQRELVREYEAKCERKKLAQPPAWVGYALGGTLAFVVAAAVLGGVCSGNIAYCQAAIDTGRRPWYWLPKIGNPLPPRQMSACESCGHQKPETDDQYRARLGLPPLRPDS